MNSNEQNNATSNKDTEQAPTLEDIQIDDASLGKSAAIISACTVVSRITGFIRTWAMAFALGSTFLSSSYQVANNLPSMLYELVMGGMLTTAFLPIYISVKNKEGNVKSNEYASNLLSLVTIALIIISLLCILFPQVVIFTQSFYTDQQSMATAVLLFQFFAIQTIFYGGSSILSGLLNSNRDYFWSSFAPVFNNLVVIITFVIYSIIAPTNPQEALYVIAIGNPLGVFAQMALQIPALKKNGIKLRFRINLKDPHIKETLSLGIPAVVVMIFTFATVSVMNAASYSFCDNGPSVIVYAKFWFVLPYSFFAVSITTSLFTELSHLHERNENKLFIDCVTRGCSQIVFLLTIFMLYLMAYSFPLVSIYHVGAFTEESIGQIASFLCVLAIGLPFYGLCTLFQKTFSSMRKMGTYATICIIASIVQIALTMLSASLAKNYSFIPIESIAVASIAFYFVLSMLSLFYLKHKYLEMNIMSVLSTFVKSLIIGTLGAFVGYIVLILLQHLFGKFDSSAVLAFAYVVISGCVSLTTTFGIAYIAKIPEAKPIFMLMNKVISKLSKAKTTDA